MKSHRAVVLIPAWLILCVIAPGLGGCNEVNYTRVPNYAVNIDLDNTGLWETYGVSGYGSSRNFILEEGEPKGFPYKSGSRTGYGGVLLIEGQNSFSGDVQPLAYDLSCPVERLPDVRVYVNPGNYEAICPKCGSHYNVVEAGGNAVAGEALDYGYGLRRHHVYAAANGGYIIRND